MVSTLEYACISDQGKVRSINQDNFFCVHTSLPMNTERTNGVISGHVETSHGALFAVFDGMGGEERGEAASYLAASTAEGYAFTADPLSLRSFCREVNGKVVAFAKENHLQTCGSTAAMLYVHDNRATVCNLGDSRVYEVKQDCLKQLSKDHVLSIPGKRKAPLLQFLGIPEDEMLLDPYMEERPLVKKDCYLICSDGLTDMVEETEIAHMIAQHESLSESAQALLDAAMAAGGRDNTTLILVRVVSAQKKLCDFWPFSLLKRR